MNFTLQLFEKTLLAIKTVPKKHAKLLNPFRLLLAQNYLMLKTKKRKRRKHYET